MRVVSVIHYPEFGGPHNQALRLAGPLAAEGVETITVLPPGPAADRLRAANLPVETLPLGRIRTVLDLRAQAASTGKLPIDIVALTRLFRRLKPDVVQLNGLTNPHGAIAARLLGIPVVWQLLDTRPPPKARRILMPQVAALADVVMPIGEQVAKAHPGADRFGERMVLYYPPVDTELFHPGDRSTLRDELQIAADVPLVGVVGNVNPQKGHEHFIAAASLVRESSPDTRFIIAGHIYPNHTDYYEALVAQAEQLGLKVERDLYFLGSRSDVPNILTALDVVALASVPYSEGTPTAILEAMACGVPTVATDVGSVREVVKRGETGFVVPPEDPNALASHIKCLIQNSDMRTRMGMAGRDRIVADFSLDRCVEAHVLGYQLAMAHRQAKKQAFLRSVTVPINDSHIANGSVSDLLSCPSCRGKLRWEERSIRCVECESTFPIVDDIPLLLAPTNGKSSGDSPDAGAEEYKALQAAFYDGEDREFETTRPHDTPRVYQWLLTEKFRRSVQAIPSELSGHTVLTVCGGSGMDAEFLARAGATVIASDLSLGAAQRTKERARRYGLPITSIVADIEHLPFADGGVDLVYVHDGLHHLDDPSKGLREMARVAARAISITEPARAFATAVAVKLGIAQQVEDAGNRVERLNPDDIAERLKRDGFDVVHAERYAMFYRHHPGFVTATLSAPGMFALTRFTWRTANLVLGPIGNKLTVQAIRSPRTTKAG